MGYDGNLAEHFQEYSLQLRKLSNGLSCRTADEFQQLIIWLKYVIKPRTDKKLHERIDSILNEANPKGVVAMMSNIEIALAESHCRA